MTGNGIQSRLNGNNLRPKVALNSTVGENETQSKHYLHNVEEYVKKYELFKKLPERPVYGSMTMHTNTQMFFNNRKDK